MRSCVIFNPAAKGDKARRFRRHLDEIGSQSVLKMTGGPGDARRLAAEAVEEGFDTVVAAGGDGTVNEVLNGLADVAEGLTRSRLAVLPLGTVNVFARELGLPDRLKEAWEAIRRGREDLIDLPSVEFQAGAARQSRVFIQLAGAGLDARAIELVHWPLKKKIGPLAYIYAGLQAITEPPAQIRITAGDKTASGALVLIGNGRLYGGPYQVFPRADLQDGLLEVCVFPKANWWTLARCGPELLLRHRLPGSAVEMFQAEKLSLAGIGQTPVEADGELLGHLPATFTVQRASLRVVRP